MSFPALQLTNAGRQIIIKALSGECGIEFTKFGIGNGEAPADANLLTNLVNIVKSLSINTITTGVGCANLSSTLDNANLEAGFWWKELGIYATDPDLGEVLYAYAHAGDYAEFIPAFSTQNYLRTTLNVTVVVGDAENVTAVIGDYVGYATTEEFDAHKNDNTNPHAVSKEQVGLGNVPNVATNDQQPTFTAASSVATINSGEKLSVIFGKIKAAISALITHFNTTNPHGITTTLIGAAKASHVHSAADITSGILGGARGGTGYSSADTAAVSFLSKALSYDSNPNIPKASINWNSLTTPGIYFVFYGCTNHPPSDTNYIVMVIKDSANSILQLAISDNSETAKIYRRSRIDKTWDSWT